MSFSPVPGSRKAEANYLDISTESFPFKLNYPGTGKSTVPNRISDPNDPGDQLLAGGLSGLWYDADSTVSPFPMWGLRLKTSPRSRALPLAERKSLTTLISCFRFTN